VRTNKPIKRRDFIHTIAAVGMSAPFINISKESLYAGNQSDCRSLCIFSKHLQFLPGYDAMAETAAEIGFDGIDLAVRPGGHVLPENVEKDLPKAVKAIKKAGLKAPMMVTAIKGPKDPLTENILRTASDLGIKYYRMGYVRYDEKLGITKSLEKFKSVIADLAAINEKYHLHGAYQNHSGLRIGGPVWDLWLLLKDLDPQWIGCQYDIRHATVEGAHSWPLGMKLLLPYIKTTAIKDFYWLRENGNWKVKNCMLGEGMVNFEAYFKIYKEAAIMDPITLHVEYHIFNKSDRLDVKREKTIKAMQKDLKTLRSMMKEYGL
jgi:sugar phosphate isomerase/epimerase